MSARADRLLALAVAALIAALLTAFFTDRAFFDWAFERHQNTASWIARPVLLLPFCYFAWRRSLAGIMVSVVAILTSMFWFPAPETPRADIVDFLATERRLLSEGWTGETLFAACAAIVYGAALAAAFWKRSWKLGLVVAAAGAVLKILWSEFLSPDTGQSVVPFALGGLAVLVVAVLVAIGWSARRSGRAGR
jgi:predicted outer membrane lipoprotein